MRIGEVRRGADRRDQNGREDRYSEVGRSRWIDSKAQDSSINNSNSPPKIQ